MTGSLAASLARIRNALRGLLGLRQVLFVSLLSMMASTGCNGMNRRPAPKNVGPFVERSLPERKPSPAARRERFHHAYAQGMRLIEAGNPGLAIGAFEEAVEMDPDSFEGWFNMAACHEQMGDPIAAMKIYRRLLDVNPSDPDCYANIGTCCIKLYHRERNSSWKQMAIEAWEQSLALQPQQPDLRRYLASCESSEE